MGPQCKKKKQGHPPAEGLALAPMVANLFELEKTRRPHAEKLDQTAALAHGAVDFAGNGPGS